MLSAIPGFWASCSRKNNLPVKRTFIQCTIKDASDKKIYGAFDYSSENNVLSLHQNTAYKLEISVIYNVTGNDTNNGSYGPLTLNNDKLKLTFDIKAVNLNISEYIDDRKLIVYSLKGQNKGITTEINTQYNDVNNEIIPLTFTVNFI